MDADCSALELNPLICSASTCARFNSKWRILNLNQALPRMLRESYHPGLYFCRRIWGVSLPRTLHVRRCCRRLCRSIACHHAPAASCTSHLLTPLTGSTSGTSCWLQVFIDDKIQNWLENCFSAFHQLNWWIVNNQSHPGKQLLINANYSGYISGLVLKPAL